MFGIESRILGFTTETLCLGAIEIFPFFFFPNRTLDMKATEEDTKEFPLPGFKTIFYPVLLCFILLLMSKLKYSSQMKNYLLFVPLWGLNENSLNHFHNYDLFSTAVNTTFILRLLLLFIIAATKCCFNNCPIT